jgi:hypothetical protein
MLPDGGTGAGGTQVLLTGSGFTGATAVSFGGNIAQSFQLFDDHAILAVSPPGTGTVPVSVTTSNGTTIAVGNFSYFGITSLDTTTGAPDGGTSVVIHGYGFSSVGSVVFGVMPAQSYTVASPTEIDAVSPAGLGTVDVQVVNGFAPSPPSSTATFTYQGGPAGSSGITEGTGPTAMQSYAAQVSPYCLPTSGAFCAVVGWIIKHLVGADTPGATTCALPGCISPKKYLEGIAIAVITRFCVLEIVGCAAATVAIADFAAAALEPAIAGVIVGLGIYEGLKLLCGWLGSGGVFGLCSLYVDPSGAVVDTSGSPVNGATATLLGQGSGGSFLAVDPSSGAIIPATNPERTGSSGEFDWDALAGTYEVEASAPGCYTPGNPSQTSAFTSPFVIPPPSVGLMLTLQCPGSPPPPVPTVTGVDPGGGPTGGGNTVDIVGTSLTGATAVRFGAVPATQTRVLSPYAIAAVVPAGTGTVDITVTTGGGTSTTTGLDSYSYDASQAVPGGPQIESITPSGAPLTGGTLVTITGSNLAGAFGVAFGGTPSSQISDVSATQVEAIAPAAQFPARVDVSVTTPIGTSIPVAADTFTYGAPPPPATTSVTVTASRNAIIYGQRVTLSATVSPTDGGGIVSFSADGSAIGGCDAVPLALSGGSYEASCSAAQLPGGDHTMTAAYSGDPSYAASSDSTNLYVDATPHNAAAPSISGNTTERQTLTESHGSWTNNPTSFADQWQHCDPSGNACSDIAGATAPTYTLTAADVGHTIRVEESATNGFGAGGPVSSPQTGLVAANGNGPPVNSIPPVASGSATKGETISSTTGTWSGAPPLTYSYQWQRCAPKCSNIAGATASTFKLTNADIGASIRAVVAAANSGGTASADSNWIGLVQPTPAQIAAAIRRLLAPSGKAATIAAILKAGGFAFGFNAPGPAKLTISWYQAPAGAHLTGTTKPKPVLVATASVSAATAGRLKVKLELTGAGRRLLQGSRRLTLSSKVTFTPVGGKRTSDRRVFTVTR